MSAAFNRRREDDVLTPSFVRFQDVVYSAGGQAQPGTTPSPFADTVPGTTATTATLTVGAPRIISGIDTIGDLDFYKIELVAGHEYQISLLGYQPAAAGDPLGPVGLRLADSYLELYDGAGNLITAADGGADTDFNDVNSGFDAVLTFTAISTGTYYINARAFDNIPLDGPNGDMIGDYQIFARDVTDDPSLYQPYYAPTSPLYAIDWGTRVNRVNQSVANPDGNEGIRPTGNAPGVIPATNPNQVAGKNVISIYFAKAGDVFVSNDLTNPGLPPATITATGVQQFEHDAVMTALAQFANVADIVYVEVNDRAKADFIYTSYIGTPGPGVSLLGSMSPPDESDEGLAQFNSGDQRWNALNLQQGGFSYVTLIHEFGHGHGLAHPHDNGGHSGIMNGVTAEGAGVADYTTGDFHLNQSVFTMMSYEDGWQDSPYGNAATNVGYGYLGGLMAFDIAAIQDKYGVNEDVATGDNVYVLKDVNAAGTFYSCIWDTGGNDTISYSGARDANIDLRAATLRYEVGGGGWVSYATGIFGGYTIANSVVIENASGGSGNDLLIGNAANNRLDGGAGDDTLNAAGGGVDTLIGGIGNDGFYLGGAWDAADSIDGGAGSDQIGLQGVYAGLTLGASSTVGVETVVLLGGDDTRFGYAGGPTSYNLTLVDANVAASTLLVFQANTLRTGETFTLNAAAETNGFIRTYGGFGNDVITGGQSDDGFYFGQGRFGAGDRVDGRGGFDALALQGEFSGGSAVTFGATQMAGIEVINLLSGAETRFGGGGASFSYTLTMNDGNVAAGASLGIQGNALGVGEVLIFDGRAELDGRFQVFGGAGNDTILLGAGADQVFGGAGIDSINGGGGADRITGGADGDRLTGGAGNDVFAYLQTSDSASTGRDQILDFATGDKIDLSAIDADTTLAGIQQFSFRSVPSFTGAGQLVAYNAGGNTWLVEGDTNGDGSADISIVVTSDHALTAADFTGLAGQGGGAFESGSGADVGSAGFGTGGSDLFPPQFDSGSFHIIMPAAEF